MDFGRITDPNAWRSAMANLLRRGEEVGTYIESAPQKAGQAIIDAGQRQRTLMNQAFDPTGKTLIRDPQAANQAAMNLFEGPLGIAPAGITAWHGSPHIFDKFDMSKVGTGEGAQSYGHGMYFAESPTVAQTYKTAGLSTKAPDRATEFIIRAKEATQNDQSAKQFLQKRLAEATDDVKPYLQKALDNFDSFKSGNLYKVDIPDEQIPKMLDWDKPLSQQPASVQNWLKDPYNAYKEKLIAKDVGGNEPTGNLIYNRLQELMSEGKKSDVFANQANLGALNASRELADYGITGIRYLDEGSRGTGKGTSNFVVFDPSTVKILERNNQPLTRKELLQQELDKLTK